jgi:2-polyprenyl-6-methoxyphenol hydroxylase-like FAD-dependent oxidoreductase
LAAVGGREHRLVEIAVVGGGIVGLTLALHLKQRGYDCRVYETAPKIEPLGVGITLLPHAMREFAALGLTDRLREVGIENRESAFFNRHGQLIYKEPRGLYAGYDVPEVGIHRGNLHKVLYDTAQRTIGADRIITNRHCTGLEQDEHAVTLGFRETSTGTPLPPVRADIAIACDGVNSALRRQFYPNDSLKFAGINTWRGVTRRKPILDGRTYMRIGSIDTGKMVIYPIVDNIDGEGNQLINWMAEIRRSDVTMNDWNQAGELEDFLPIYKDWRFDWLDVPELICSADVVLEYPMVDKDPVSQWTFGRVTLMGDAAHPMYPRGSNGAAQGAIDARTFADALEKLGDPVAALRAYESARLEPTANVVRTNREFPPDYMIIKVEELTGGRPFDNIDDVISQEELRAISERYKQIAGFSLRQ